MQNKRDLARQKIREMASQQLRQDDVADFFENVYTGAEGDTENIPWADLQPHPLALEWLQREKIDGSGKNALVVGCGLGDDAEELAKRGFHVTAFDISPRAIDWCHQRFPLSSIDYRVCDLLSTPHEWQQGFDFVLEIYTVQAMPRELQARASAIIGNTVAPGGRLLVISRIRTAQDEARPFPWLLTRADLAEFAQSGLHELMYEEVEARDGRHFRVLYGRNEKGLVQ